MRLITIPISHYCEKVRWGLERLDLPYYEERHLQGFHYPSTYWVSGGPTVPVLVDGARVISDSTAILKHLEQYAPPEQRLYPEDSELRLQVETWEARFNELGVDSRKWMYLQCLPFPKTTLRFFCQGVPRMEKTLAPVFFPLLKAFVRARLNISDTEVGAALERSRALVCRIDALLADGRRYLVGGRFSAADLTLACMAAPFLLPSRYGIQLPTLDEVPPGMVGVVKEFRATATGQYVLGLFAAK